MDTTFKLGPYYVTILSARHPLLKRRIMNSHQLDPHGNLPLAIHIHERKFETDHQNFITEVVKAVDDALPPDASYRLSRKDITLCSDREYDAKYLFRNTAEKNSNATVQRQLRNAPCWNHLGDNVKAKLRKLKFGEKATIRAVRDFKWLLQSASEEEYMSRKEELFAVDGTVSPWHTKAAKAYFEKHLHQVCINEACTFRLEEAGIKNAQYGVTNNVSESFNALLKRRTELQELPVSENLLIFYFTMRMSVVQLQAGYYQTGEFEVCEEYKMYLERDPRNAPSVNVQTVNEMKQFLHTALADPTKTIPHPSIPNTDIPRQRQTVAKIAELIHANGNVELMASDNRFLVKALNGKKYVVSLGPNMECECGRPNVNIYGLPSTNVVLCKTLGVHKE